MSLYRRDGSGYWWCKFYSAGVCVRKSTRQKDRDAAAGVEAAFRMAARGADRRKIVGVIDALMNVAGCGGSGDDGLRIAEAWGAYLVAYRASGRTVAAQTLSTRRGALRRLERWTATSAPGVERVEDVSRSVAGAFAAWLTTQPIKAKTRRDIILELGGIWRALARTREHLEDVWRHVVPARGMSERTDPFTREEEERVLDAARRIGDGWYEVSVIARHTGLRYTDAALLRWDNVDLDRGVIEIAPRKTRRHGIALRIPIAPPLMEMFQEARKRPQERAADWVCPRAATVARTHKRRYCAAFRDVLAAAGITEGRHTFHSWRHTFRSRLAEAGVDTDTAMRLCGHTTREMSAWYDHADHIEEMREAVEAAAGTAKKARRKRRAT